MGGGRGGWGGLLNNIVMIICLESVRIKIGLFDFKFYVFKWRFFDFVVL